MEHIWLNKFCSMHDNGEWIVHPSRSCSGTCIATTGASVASSKLESFKLMGSPPDVWLQKLTGGRKGQWSVTIHQMSGWRIVFGFDDGEFLNVEIVDFHRG